MQQNVSEQTNSTFSDAILLNNSTVMSNENNDGGLPAVLYWEKECHRNLLAQHSAVIRDILIKAWNEIDKKRIEDHAEISDPLYRAGTYPHFLNSIYCQNFLLEAFTIRITLVTSSYLVKYRYNVNVKSLLTQLIDSIAVLNRYFDSSESSTTRFQPAFITTGNEGIMHLKNAWYLRAQEFLRRTSRDTRIKTLAENISKVATEAFMNRKTVNGVLLENSEINCGLPKK